MVKLEHPERLSSFKFGGNSVRVHNPEHPERLSICKFGGNSGRVFKSEHPSRLSFRKLPFSCGRVVNLENLKLARCSVQTNRKFGLF